MEKLQRTLYFLLGAVCLLQLIAGVNVANLLLAYRAAVFRNTLQVFTGRWCKSFTHSGGRVRWLQKVVCVRSLVTVQVLQTDHVYKSSAPGAFESPATTLR